MNKAGLAFGGVAYLAAAVALNFIVACVCVSKVTTPGGRPMPSGLMSGAAGTWPDGDTKWPAPKVSVTELRGYTTKMWLQTANSTAEGLAAVTGGSDATRFWWRVEAGWPARAFSQTRTHEFWNVPMPSGYVPLKYIDDGVEIKGEKWPVQPVWPGFVLNTLLYAAVVAAVCHPLVLGVIRLRSKYVRRRRGLCGGCGYDRKGLEKSAACPECGLVAA